MPRPRRARQPREPKAPVTYAISPDIELVIAKLVGGNAVQFGWLNNFKVGGVLISGSKAKDTGGCQAIGRFVKVIPLWQQLTQYSVVVVIQGWAWDRLDETGREALTAHLLCHGSMSEKGALRLEKHDLSEFHFVARNYGAWDESIALFDQQLALFTGPDKVQPKTNGKPKLAAVPDPDEDLRPTGDVNTAALRGEADRSITPDTDGPVH